MARRLIGTFCNVEGCRPGLPLLNAATAEYASCNSRRVLWEVRQRSLGEGDRGRRNVLEGTGRGIFARRASSSTGNEYGDF